MRQTVYHSCEANCVSFVYYSNLTAVEPWHGLVEVMAGFKFDAC